MTYPQRSAPAGSLVHRKQKKVETIRAVACLGLAVLLAGCATRSEDIAASYVSPLQYQSYSCSQLGEEAQRVAAQAGAAMEMQNSNADTDAAGMAIGLLILWPMLLFNQGDGAAAAEVARLKGEMTALEQANIQKRCGLTFQTAPQSP